MSGILQRMDYKSTNCGPKKPPNLLKGEQIAHAYCNLKNKKSRIWLEVKDANHAKDYIFKRNPISLK